MDAKEISCSRQLIELIIIWSKLMLRYLFLTIILVGFSIAGLGVYHDWTHTCLIYGTGGVPPAFKRCILWGD